MNMVRTYGDALTATGWPRIARGHCIARAFDNHQRRLVHYIARAFDNYQRISSDALMSALIGIDEAALNECGGITLDSLLRAGVLIENQNGEWELAARGGARIPSQQSLL